MVARARCSFQISLRRRTDVVDVAGCPERSPPHTVDDQWCSSGQVDAIMANQCVKLVVRRLAVPVLLAISITFVWVVLADITENGPPPTLTRPGPGSKSSHINAPDADDEGDGASAQSFSAHGTGHYGGGSAEPANNLTVTIGHVELLYPGLNRTVPLRVTNPFGFAIRITRFDVASPGTSACPANHLSVGTHRADGPVIEANGFGDTQTTIGLSGSAPDSCQSERFDFSVTVTAVMS